MRIVFQLFVHGIPKAQPRPRMTAHGHVFNPKSAAVWKEAVKAAFLSCRKPVITGPVHLQVTFFMPAPRGVILKDDQYIPHIRKPDTDNLLKAVMDSLTAARVWKDDAQVYSIEASKGYAKKTGARIKIFEERDFEEKE